jgi:hypothetical protein
VIAGLIAILSKKHKGKHSTFGAIYYWVLWVVFATSTLIAIFRWKEDYHLFLLGIVSFVSALIGRTALRNKWKKWSVIHTIGMSLSYIFLIVAFYVDNGRFLPLWKELDPILYWLLPLLVGIPLTIRTLLRHPLTKGHFK